MSIEETSKVNNEGVEEISKLIVEEMTEEWNYDSDYWRNTDEEWTEEASEEWTYEAQEYEEQSEQSTEES